jgi:hypothetical protein
MAVHVPLSLEAIMECKLLMMATSNIFSPSSGKPILTPSQDIVLGAYYLTIEPRTKPAKNVRVPLLSGLQEVLYAKADGAHQDARLGRCPESGFRASETVYGDTKRKSLRTTVGRVIFNQIWPTGLGFVNFPVPKSKLGDLILNTYKISGNHITVETLDKLKELGFATAFQAGISIGIDDMIIPESKKEIVHDSRKKIAEVESPVQQGHHHRRRALQQGGRHLDRRDRQDREGSLRQAREQRRQDGGQPRLHHDGLRRPRQQAAGPPAVRHPRPHGQARRVKSSSARFCPRSARASRCSSTSSRPTAPARVSPTPRSRRPMPVTSPASSATWRWT